MTKFFNTKLYVINGGAKVMRNKHDAEDYCHEHGIALERIETFDSKKEYDRWRALRTLQEDGEIRDLQRQTRFEIIPGYYEERVVRYKNVTRWYIDELNIYDKKSLAVTHCRLMGLDKALIKKITETVPVCRKVTVERPHYYTADFTYLTLDGELVVEDVKSEYTRKEPDYILRRALMLHVHGIKIKEIL